MRSDLKLIHTATPDTTKLSCLCRVRSGGVNWIPDNSRLCRRQKICSRNTFRTIVQFTPAHQTQHRQDGLVVSGRQCELDITGICRRISHMGFEGESLEGIRGTSFLQQFR